MKTALLVASTLKNGTSNGRKNMGDYIQSLASELFFDKIDEYIDREKLKEYKSESGKAKMIMNAWYMWYPENWPPSDDILPLLISMHFSPINASRVLSVDGINYLKNHGPVGCRDKETEILLKKYDIPCYFSGCLTLALGEKYKSHNKGNKIIFVDPYLEVICKKNDRLSVISTIINVFRCLYYGVINLKQIKQLKQKFHHSNIFDNRLKNILLFLNISAFYKTYSSYFEDQLLFNAEYLSHMVRVGEKTSILSEEDKLNYARNMIRQYGEASLVITSRLHCALPCLGLETPVIFVTGDLLESKSSLVGKNRFGGLTNLLRTMHYNNFCLSTADNTIIKKINADTFITNKKDYLPIKEALLKKCYDFVSNNP
jgi:hypothetical protein